MHRQKHNNRRTLAEQVFRPLAAGALVLCAVLAGCAAAALCSVLPVGWAVLAAMGIFAVTGGGTVALLHLLCRYYLDPVTRAAAAVGQAAAGDHSAPLTGIPRTTGETELLLNAAENLGTKSTECLLALEDVLRRMAEGDLTAELPCGRGAECGGACGALEGLSQKLRGGIGSVRSALDQIAAQLDELEGEVRTLSQSRQDRRQDREALTRALEHLTGCAQSRAEGVRSVSGGAENLSRQLEDYGKRSEELRRAVERINECAAEEEQIVRSMESAAFQCSVLARTAYMEAAGAGVNGKGFAVVASELRMLASRSAQAAQEAAALMEEMDASIRESASLAAVASRELWKISDGSQELRRRAASALEEVREMKGEQDAVRQAARLSAAAEEDRLLTSRAAVSATLLRERAARLREALRVFRLN